MKWQTIGKTDLEKLPRLPLSISENNNRLHLAKISFHYQDFQKNLTAVSVIVTVCANKMGPLSPDFYHQNIGNIHHQTLSSLLYIRSYLEFDQVTMDHLVHGSLLQRFIMILTVRNGPMSVDP